VKLGFSDLGSADNKYKMKKTTEEMHVFVNAWSQAVMGGKWPLICK